MSLDDLFSELERRPTLRIRLRRARRWLGDVRYTIRRRPVHAWHRMRRGYSDADTYTFHIYLSGVIVGGLRQLRERSIGYPAQLTAEQWDAILDEMIVGFEIAYADDWEAPNDPRVRRALSLFAEHYFSLWD